MESLFILIPLAVVIVTIAVGVFFWAVKSGQYDDLNTEGQRILFDEKPKDAALKPKSQQTPKVDEVEPKEDRPSF